MMFFVYILLSKKFKRTYVGQSDDLSARLEKHNSGAVRSTKAFRPWELIYQERYDTRAEAMRREMWFKSSSGRKKIAELLRNLEHSGLSTPS